MEASGVAFQISLAAAAAASSGANHVRQFSGGVLRVSSVKKSIPSLRFSGVQSSAGSNSTSGFCDNGHLEHYNATVQRKEEKELKSAKKTMKKKLKLIKGLSKKLSAFSDIGFGLDPDSDSGLTHQVKGKMISEAAELLLGQLEELRREEMELKRKKKEEKAKQKRMMGQEEDDSDSSSESECGEEVVDMSRLKSETPLALASNEEEQMAINLEANTEEIRLLGNKILGGGNCSSSSRRRFDGKKIEVCMGGKCKKSGGASLLEEFEKAVGSEVVVGCKCMGKCRQGPNVRVVNNGAAAAGEKEMDPPLCIGVGLEDVSLIVSNFIGGGIGSNQLSEFGLAQPAAAASVS